MRPGAAVVSVDASVVKEDRCPPAEAIGSETEEAKKRLVLPGNAWIAGKKSIANLQPDCRAPTHPVLAGGTEPENDLTTRSPR